MYLAFSEKGQRYLSYALQKCDGNGICASLSKDLVCGMVAGLRPARKRERFCGRKRHAGEFAIATSFSFQAELHTLLVSNSSRV